MKQYGKIVLTLSREVPDDLEKKFSDLVNKLNEKLAKGVKQKELSAKIVGYDVEDKKLSFKVESRIISIRDAALRIKNTLQPIFGKFRIGIRDIEVKDGVIVIEGIHKVSLKLPFVEKTEICESQTKIFLRTLDERELKKPILERLLKLLQEKEARQAWHGKAESKYIIRESKQKIEKPTKRDYDKLLEEIGWIKWFSQGQWFYTPPYAYLLKMIQEIFIEEVLKPLDFEEAIFPKMYPVEVGLKTGHLKGTINSILFVSFPISYDIAKFEEFIDYISVFKEVKPEMLKDYLEHPKNFLCFAQCEPFYQFLEKEIFNDKDLPIKWFDRSGPSFRWEAGGLKGTERLIEFHRIEVVWLGLPEQVVEIRNQLLEKYEKFMDKALDMEWRWALVMPWYLEHAGVAKEIEKEIDKPGTIDFEAWLPYKGGRKDEKSWLEVGNISIHGNKFTSSFKIKSSRGAELWTGCSGFGSERWLLAFIAQHGLDPSNWPNKIKSYLKKIKFPKSLVTPTYPKEKGKEELRELITKFQQIAK